MNKRITRPALAIAAIAAFFALSSPAFAEGHGGGFAGGGHPGAGHVGGGYSGGGRVGGGYSGGGQMHGGFNGGVRPGGSFNRGARAVGGYGAGGRYSASQFGGAGRIAGARYPGSHFGGASSIPRGIGYGGHPRTWGGGYFHGGYWPRAYFHSGFVRFFPILPAFYSTFWFGGVPYYYWDDAYYTWNSADNGYVATDPPPVSDNSASPTGSADSPQAGGASKIYAYPKNGQTDDQAATDRFQCHQWAVSQTGFDPSSGSGQPASANASSDYRRATVACLDARGYSAN